MEHTKLLYALLTSQCNLSCPYCDVKNCEDNFNRDLFMKELHDFNGEIILFGGEPTLYPDRLLDVFISDPIINRKIRSMTTNLIKVDDTILTLMQLIRGIGTSYSPTRFKDNEYQIWLNNIDLMERKIPGKKVRVLSTMTEELLNISPAEFMKIMQSWNSNVIEDIHFEHYVGEETNPEYFERCDDWLCEIYKIWDTPIKMYNIERIKHWYNDCSGIYTLHPDGTMTKGCPHVQKIHIPKECYSCDKYNECRPCQLQRYCSFSKKFANLVANDQYTKK